MLTHKTYRDSTTRTIELYYNDVLVCTITKHYSNGVFVQCFYARVRSFNTLSQALQYSKLLVKAHKNYGY